MLKFAARKLSFIVLLASLAWLSSCRTAVDQCTDVGCSRNGEPITPKIFDTDAPDASANTTADSAPQLGCPTNVPPPLRRWKPKEPRGPDSQEAKKVYNRALTLDVITPGASKPALAERHDRGIRSLAVQGLSYSLLSSAEFKADVLRQELSAKASDPNSVVLFLGSSANSIAADESIELLHKFQDMDAKLVFAASRTCPGLCNIDDWPRPMPASAPRYILPDYFVGYTSALVAMLDQLPPVIAGVNMTDLERIVTLFLMKESRTALGISVDYRSEIFQDLSHADDDLNDGEFSLDFTFRGRPDTKLFARQFGTYPSIVIGGRNTKLLNQIGNYIPLAWTDKDGCIHCKEHQACINASSPVEAFPKLFVSLVIPAPSAYLELSLESFSKQVYPQERITLHIHFDTAVDRALQRNINITKQWIRSQKYASFKLSSQLSAVKSQADAMQAAMDSGADMALFLDPAFRFTNPTALIDLLQQNRTIIAPVATRYKKFFSNFWGASIGDLETVCQDDVVPCSQWAAEGECENNPLYMKEHCKLSCGVCVPQQNPWNIDYKRSFDYMKIVQRERLGVWAVPLAFGAVLVRAAALKPTLEVYSASVADAPSDPWASYTLLSHAMRAAGYQIHVSNMLEYGHLIDSSDYPMNRVHPELYLVESNLPEWREWYLHPDYDKWSRTDMARDSIDDHICTDIYTFALASERFCMEFIEESEASNQWSSGDFNDRRLKGGYEPVPTRDIHFEQIDYKKPFYDLLHAFVAPIAAHHYTGYRLSARQNLDFIVKYTPDGQASLRPHHDASTMTMVLALNRRGTDFEGGGTRFTRQNCTVYSPMGHATIHPGRLTHQHEGLATTKGTRYIVVTFIDQ